MDKSNEDDDLKEDEVETSKSVRDLCQLTVKQLKMKLVDRGSKTGRKGMN